MVLERSVRIRIFFVRNCEAADSSLLTKDDAGGGEDDMDVIYRIGNGTYSKLLKHSDSIYFYSLIECGIYGGCAC